MSTRSRTPGGIKHQGIGNQTPEKTGWRRFRLTDPQVAEGGVAAASIYTSLTEDASLTRWVTPDYGDNNYTTSGRGANGRVFSQPLTNSKGQGILLTEAFTLRVIIELIAISGADWGGAREPEPWINVGISGQAAVGDIPANNYLAMAVDSVVPHANQYDKPKVGYNVGPIDNSEAYFYGNNETPTTDSFPTYYYADIRIGPDTDDTITLNTSISMRAYDGDKNHFGPNQWVRYEPSDSLAVEETGQAYLFVGITPEGNNGVVLNLGDPVTTDFRVWYMVSHAESWIPGGNP